MVFSDMFISIENYLSRIGLFVLILLYINGNDNILS